MEPVPVKGRVKWLDAARTLAKPIANALGSGDVRAANPLETAKTSWIMKHDIVNAGIGQTASHPNMVVGLCGCIRMTGLQSP